MDGASRNRRMVERTVGDDDPEGGGCSGEVARLAKQVNYGVANDR